MPRTKQEIEYKPIPGAVYKVVVDKLGHEDDWGYRDHEISAEEYPEVNFVRLEKAKLVVRCDKDAPKPEAEKSDAIMAARPHREFGTEAQTEPGQGPVMGGKAAPQAAQAPGRGTGTTQAPLPPPPAPPQMPPPKDK